MTEQPDRLAVYDNDGVLICYRPNYDKLGVAEAVERRVFEGELAANPPRSNIGQILQMREITHFEDQMRQHYGEGA